MELIEHFKTSEYPGGVAYTIMERMKRKSRPTDRISAVEAEKELMLLNMKSDQDPDEYFDKLATLRNKYKTDSKILDNNKMITATITKTLRKCPSALISVIR